MEEYMMQKIEKVIIGIIIGAVPVIACFLAGWWISIPLVSESRIIQYALTGLLLGTLIDVIFLRNWVRHAYTMKFWVCGLRQYYHERRWALSHVFRSHGLSGPGRR